MPEVTIHHHINIRKHKRGLYLYLLKKGFDNLTEPEKKILENLCIDDDIQLLLINGAAFQEEK